MHRGQSSGGVKTLIKNRTKIRGQFITVEEIGGMFKFCENRVGICNMHHQLSGGWMPLTRADTLNALFRGVSGGLRACNS